MLVKTKLRFLIPAVFLLALVFTTCEAPMGMGKPIDWEEPVLTMEKVSNPLYVRKGTTLKGTATDNIEVTRITFTDKTTGRELFPVVRDGDNWFIELKFTEKDNGEKIIGEIRAYDRMNNSGERSVAFVTMIIDILPPVIESISIKRTDTKIAFLEPLSVLKELETSDQWGQKEGNKLKYQNGWFTINSAITDGETTVEVVSLDFYDFYKDNNTALISFPFDNPDESKYFPRWSIKEEEIINAGAAKWGAAYKTNYYKKDGEGDRYYYRVVVKAKDKSENESKGFIEEDEGFICMWSRSDEPKGILDPVIGTNIARGTPLPVDFFDDDSLLWAYAGLLTEEQWKGDKPISSDGTKITGVSNEEKLLFLKKRLTGNDGEKDTDVTLGTQGEVFNWYFDRYAGTVFNGMDDKDKKVTELIGGKSLDLQTVYIQTGNREEDYGKYVLFSIVADKKLPPHSKQGPEWTNQDIWRGRALVIEIMDENVPLIVFDTTKAKPGEPPKLFSPEENTFPQLTDGEFFNIVGYTLRENGANVSNPAASAPNLVTTFRMAWIPYTLPDIPGEAKGGDGYIRRVQNALRNKDFETMPPGVQYWDFEPSDTPGTGKLSTETLDYVIDKSHYSKQNFVKRFSVLGGADDIKPDTKNFVYNNRLENETKLFIFYAVDNMGHEVFRQLRILGNKTPPEFVIYDFTHHLTSDSFLPPANPALPDPNDSTFFTGGVFDGTKYYPVLNNVNLAKYNTIKGVIGKTSIDGKPIPSDDDITIPFQIYPRGTIVKYHIVAEKQGVIAVESIVMKDITFAGTSGGQVVGSDYKPLTRDLTFCEYYPDVTQRTFLFEATDKLGNVARVQRTVAVTNAAKLENITTTTQSGTYGIGKEIILQANFSSQVYATGPSDKHPKLNIRYWKADGSAIYQEIECTEHLMASNPGAVLNFKFTVPAGTGGTGVIETLYEDTAPGAVQPIPFAPPGGNKRPIILPDFDTPNPVKIMDANRHDSAFIPGYTSESITMPNWSSKKNSLQDRKSIRLDGIRPKITTVTVGGKTAASGNTYYFKGGETLEFTLTADEDIRPSGQPILNFNRLNSGGTSLGTDTANFKYQRPSGQRALVFSLSVNDVAGDGRLAAVNIPAVSGVVSGIVDNADNGVEPDTVSALLSLAGNPTIYIKKSIPAAPQVTLTGAATKVITGSTTDTLEYNFNPVLTVQTSQSTTFPALENTIQYSLDGGLKWVNFPTTEPNWTSSAGTNSLNILNGEWDLRVRYLDLAGNEGDQTNQKIHVNKDFPRLVSITAVQPNSTYRQGDKLDFKLEFADRVEIKTLSNVTITLSNRGTNTTATTVQTLTATNQAGLNTTITFTWNPLDGREMLNGLYVSAVTLTGLQDRFGNPGLSATGANYTTANNTVTLPLSSGGSYTCPNLSPGLIVDCLAPSITTRVPANEGVSTNNRTVTLTFSEPVMIGTGRITVRPYGEYKIPAVLENSGSTVNGTYIAGFYDIYNSSLINNEDRQTLTQSANASNPSMGNLELDTRTGQSKGPYIKLTQGLKEGQGFTGNYANSNTTPRNGPSIAASTGSPFMVPDTSTKWVLDYRYSIDNNNNTQFDDPDTPAEVLVNASNTVVPAIRAVLTKAKWRWQEMDLVSSVALSNNDRTVTITLNEPLLAGLQWGFSFPEGAFTDKAGNKAVAVGSYDANGNLNTAVNSPYYFWSNGVQAPVIRVNRKSFDARTANWKNTTGRNYVEPANLTGPGGWGITDFNTVHYRIESETPGATLLAGKETGTPANNGSITADWTGTAGLGNGRGWDYPNSANNSTTATNTTEDWVRVNVVRRSGNGTYTVTENGFTTQRSITNNYQGYRSYNRDATKATLDGVTLTAFNGSGGNPTQDSFTYAALQASKNYVVAQASITNGGTTYTSGKSYEGVFRSVVALKQDSFGGGLGGADRTNNPIMVQGSNVKNGMPSISGFPVYDANETGDNRFLKIFYYAAYTSTSPANGRLYWVSTEIVSQWYFLAAAKNRNDNGQSQGGGSHMGEGDVNNYLFSGYGDLTYSRNQQ
jgi:hypothetical protein